MRILIASVLLLFFLDLAHAQQRAEPSASSNVDAIVTLLKNGLSETVIIKSIQSGGTTYNLGPSDLVKLQQAGASNRVIEAMLTPSSTAAPSPAIRGAASAPRGTTSTANDEAPSDDKPKGGSMFSRLGSRLRDSVERTAENAVDNVETSTTKAIDDATTAAERGIDNKLRAVEDKADAAASKATNEPAPRPRSRR